MMLCGCCAAHAATLRRRGRRSSGLARVPGNFSGRRRGQPRSMLRTVRTQSVGLVLHGHARVVDREPEDAVFGVVPAAGERAERCRQAHGRHTRGAGGRRRHGPAARPRSPGSRRQPWGPPRPSGRGSLPRHRCREAVDVLGHRAVGAFQQKPDHGACSGGVADLGGGERRRQESGAEQVRIGIVHADSLRPRRSRTSRDGLDGAIRTSDP